VEAMACEILHFVQNDRINLFHLYYNKAFALSGSSELKTKLNDLNAQQII